MARLTDVFGLNCVMGWFDLLLAVTGGIYLGAIFWLWLGLRRGPGGGDEQVPSVSIIIPARNEVENLGDCLLALRRQDYAGAWEVVVVDDRSDDGTGELVSQEACDWGRLKLVRAVDPPRFRCPKKSALRQGIEASTGELLLFTDADCRPSPGWVKSMVNSFSAGIGLVAGYAYPADAKSLRQKLLALDNLAIGALSAGSFGMGRPLSCTGRNLAYRRSVYEQVGGFSRIGHLVAGDDVYFMRLVAAETDWGMIFNREPGAAVPCLPPPERLGEIANQKLRHAGKAGHYRGPALLLGGAVYLFHLALAIGLVRMGWTFRPDWLLLGLWAGRWLGDGVLLWRMALRQERSLLMGLPLLELLYIPYVLLFTVIGRMNWFRWKS